ncbi:MAG: Ig-like domain-containing protein [Bacilli bacterium]
MKKHLTSLVALVAAFTLLGCNSNPSTTPSASTSTSTSTSVSTAPSTEPSTAPSAEPSTEVSTEPSTSTVAVTGVSLSSEAETIKVNASVTLTATVTPSDATNKIVTWSTSDASVATVNAGGKVTGVKEGTATITATIDGFTATCTVTVKGEYDDIADITATGSYTVKGLVTAVNTKGFMLTNGTNTIYVHANTAPTVAVGDTAKVSGTVTSYNKAFQFTNTGLSYEKIADETITKPAATALTADIANTWLSAKAFSTTDVKEYTWTATAGMSGTYTTLNIDGFEKDIEPAYVDSTVFSLTEGKDYDITAYFFGYYNYVSVMLVKADEHLYPVTGVTVTAAEDATSVRCTETLQLSAAVAPEKAPQDVIWTTSDAETATVSATGLVTGVKEGTVTITATAKDTEIADTIELTVTAAPAAPVETISLNFTAATMYIGDTKQVEATVLPTTANTSVNYTVISGLDVVSVSDSGLITALDHGTATVEVKTVGKNANGANLVQNIEITVGYKYGSETSPLTVDAAIAAMEGFENKEYSSEKAYVTGLVSSVSVADATKGQYTLTLEGTSGEKAFTLFKVELGEEVAVPVVGDTVLACGWLQLYNSTYELTYKGTENGQLLSTVHNDYTISVDTAIENGAVTVDKTAAKSGDTITITATPATGYKVSTVTVDGEAIDAVEGVYSFVCSGNNVVSATFVDDSVVLPTKLSLNVATVADEQGWANAVDVYDFPTSDENITIAATKGTSNPPKYYNSGENWRIYTGSTLTISSPTSKQIVSVTLSGAAIILTGVTADIEYSVNATTVTFSSTGTNKITDIVVNYIA